MVKYTILLTKLLKPQRLVPQTLMQHLLSTMHRAGFYGGTETRSDNSYPSAIVLLLQG